MSVDRSGADDGRGCRKHRAGRPCTCCRIGPPRTVDPQEDVVVEAQYQADRAICERGGHVFAGYASCDRCGDGEL